MTEKTALAPVIAIDGPGGAGKGTICCNVAELLGWRLLDSGALYRLLALQAIRGRQSLDDEESLAREAESLPVQFAPEPGGTRIRLAGDEVTEAIRDEKVGVAASKVAAMPAVRAALIELQRSFRSEPGLVADGRDMGSVVFPDAGVKIFLTASVAERARRRYKQLKDKGIDVSLPALSKDMADRDRRDTERSVAPLIAAPDAIVLDSTGLSISEVTNLVLRWAQEVWPQAR